MRNKNKKIFIPILIIVIIIVIASFSNNTDGDSGAVKTIRVTKNSITKKILFEGSALPSKMVEVKPNISGEIVKIHYTPGDLVKKGDVLAEIRPDPAILLELLTKENECWNAELEYLKKKKIYEDLYSLLKEKYISPEELQEAKRQFKTAERKLRYSQKSIEFYRAKYGLDSTDTDQLIKSNSIVRAPVSGTILQNFVHTGAYCKSALSQYSEGTTLCVIGDLSGYLVKLSVPESDIDAFFPGQKVAVYRRNQIQPDSGFVSQISPMGNIESQPTTFDLSIVFTPINARYRPGGTVTVEIILKRRENVLTVPISAVEIRNKKKFIYIKKNGDFIKQEIVTGLSDNHKVEVTEGLRLNDEIVINPDVFRNKQFITR